MILLAFNHSCPVYAPFLRFYLHLRTVCAVLRKQKRERIRVPFSVWQGQLARRANCRESGGGRNVFRFALQTAALVAEENLRRSECASGVISPSAKKKAIRKSEWLFSVKFALRASEIASL